MERNQYLRALDRITSVMPDHLWQYPQGQRGQVLEVIKQSLVSELDSMGLGEKARRIVEVNSQKPKQSRVLMDRGHYKK